MKKRILFLIFVMLLISLANVSAITWKHGGIDTMRLDDSGNLNIIGNLTGAYLFGNGAQLTNISTYNSTYASYNTTGLIKDWNATGLIKDWTFIEKDPMWTGNYSTYLSLFNWNKTYADTLYLTTSNGLGFWNSTFATFNKTYADTLYYGIGNSYGYYNSTSGLGNWSADKSSYSTTASANGLYKAAGIETYNSTANGFNKTYADTLYAVNTTFNNFYPLNNNFSYWNSTFATFNKTYADTLYYGIGNSYGYYNSTSGLGNWSADKSSYSTTASANGLYKAGGIETYNSTANGFNKTYADTLYVGAANVVSLVGNWTLDKSSYSTTASANGLYKAGGITTWNETFALFNKTYADTLYLTTSNGLGFWNSTFATFNKTYADTLYLTTSNGLGFWNSTFATFNKTYADTLYAVNTTFNNFYPLNNNFSYWNSTFATFNKTYADTLYEPTTVQVPNVTTTTCSGTDKISAINNLTGAVTCTADVSSAGVTQWVNYTTIEYKNNTVTGNTYIPELNVTLAANHYYRFDCIIGFNTNAIGTGLNLTMDGNVTPTMFSYRADIPFATDGAGESFGGDGTALKDSIVSSAVVAANTNYTARLWGNTYSTVSYQLFFKYKPEVTATWANITIGTNCLWTTLN